MAEDRIIGIDTFISGKHAGLKSIEETIIAKRMGVVCKDLALTSDVVELAFKTGDTIEI